MIKSKRGIVKIKNKNDSDTVGELLCIMCAVAEAVIAPRFGGGLVKRELDEMVDIVCETLNEKQRSG